MKSAVVGFIVCCSAIVIFEFLLHYSKKIGKGTCDTHSPNSESDRLDTNTKRGVAAVKAITFLGSATFLFIGAILVMRCFSNYLAIDDFSLSLRPPVWWNQVQWIIYIGLACVAACAASLWAIFEKLRQASGSNEAPNSVRHLRARAVTYFGCAAIPSLLAFVALVSGIFPASVFANKTRLQYLNVAVNDCIVGDIATAMMFDRFHVYCAEITSLDELIANSSQDSLAKRPDVVFRTYASKVGEDTVFTWRAIRWKPESNDADTSSGEIEEHLPCIARIQLAYELCRELGCDPADIFIDGKSKGNASMCAEIMDGWIAFNLGSTTSIEMALSHFEIAIAMDTTAISAYTYAAYCCNLLLDRACPPCNSGICNLDSVAASYRRHTDKYSNKYYSYLSRILNNVKDDGHYVIQKVRADRLLGEGTSELVSARIAELRGTLQFGLEPYFDDARSQFLHAHRLFSRALASSPKNVRLKLNLALLYQGLCEVELHAGNSNLAKFYLDLSYLAVAEAGRDQDAEFLTRLGQLKLEDYQHFHVNDTGLLNAADAAVSAVLENPLSSEPPKKWSYFEALVLGAAIDLQRFREDPSNIGELESAVSRLIDAARLDVKDVCWIVIMDEDFDYIRQQLSELHLGTLEQLHERIREKIANSSTS